MPRVDLTLEIDIKRTPRVIQLEGLFDVPSAKRRTVDFHFDVPIEDKDWKIGLITGPSGAGKSSVARYLFGDNLIDGYDWPVDKSVVDAFECDSIRDTTDALSSVGFSSPPSWTKPFHVLSTGEKFRATIARALIDNRDLIVIDEFTSVVDRIVAKIGSFAVSKAVRKHPKKQFIAVSCHDDIVEWLQPDWILEPHVGRFRWRSLRRRPQVELKIVRCNYSSWEWFSQYHYLTANLHKAARCFVGLINDNPVYFAAVLHFPHSKVQNYKSISRVVVHPDYQGIGVSYHASIAIAKIVKAIGGTLITHPAHPKLIEARAKSKLWKMTKPPSMRYKNAAANSKTSTISKFNPDHTLYRKVAHFKYVGPGFESTKDIEAARRLWG